MRKPNDIACCKKLYVQHPIIILEYFPSIRLNIAAKNPITKQTKEDNTRDKAINTK